ncbi:unnamed protein product [Absidia cylindrospora]
MLKPSSSPNSNKTKRRQLLSLNRPHNITPKPVNESSTAVINNTSVQQAPFSTTTSPPMTLNNDTDNSPKSRQKATENIPATLGEYYCPICNKDLSTFNTSYSRQQHIDGCLTSTVDDITEENGTVRADGSDQSMESLFMDYCSFCGKSIKHLKGVHKERHFDQCLTAIETEQRLTEQQQQLTTYAGHSIPFLQNLDICIVCHDTLPGSSLRSKITHIKRCAAQKSLTMTQLLSKIKWMQWGHIPIRNTSSTGKTMETLSSASAASSSTTTTTRPPISYSTFATEPPSTDNHAIATRSTPSLMTKKRTNPTNFTDLESAQEVDDDFSSDVLVYRVASWQQTKFKKRKPAPTEDESIAMALSLSLMNEDDHQQRRLPRRKKRKVNLDASNIVSIEESRMLARLALEKMLEKDIYDAVDPSCSSFIRFPLVTSHIQPTLPRRQNSLPSGPLSLSSTSLWSQASCLDLDVDLDLV